MKYKKRKIEWKSRSNGGRLLQDVDEGFEFAWVSKNYEQIHEFVTCKDFLQTIVYSCINRKNINLYNLRFKPSKNPSVYFDKTRLIITNWTDHSFEKKLPHCLNFLNQIEKELKMKKTVIMKCKEPPDRYRKSGIYLLESSKRWMVSPPMISLYSLFIRVGMSHKKGKKFRETISKIRNGRKKAYIECDNWNVEDADKAFKWMFKYGDRKLFGNKIKENFDDRKMRNAVVPNVDVIHDCGIISYSEWEAEDYFPHWYKEQKKDD